jgi:hypothetical protein
MPREWIEELRQHAGSDESAEIKRLRDDNARLRALVGTLCDEIKKIAEELSKLIDNDNR